MSTQISKQEAQEILGVTDRQLARYVAHGRLSTIKERGKDGVRRNFYIKEEVNALYDDLYSVEHRPAIAPSVSPSVVVASTVQGLSSALSPLLSLALSHKLFLTLKEASEYLGVPLSIVKQIVSSKKIPQFRNLGKEIRVRRTDLEKWAGKYKE